MDTSKIAIDPAVFGILLNLLSRADLAPEEEHMILDTLLEDPETFEATDEATARVVIRIKTLLELRNDVVMQVLSGALDEDPEYVRPDLEAYGRDLAETGRRVS